MIQNTWKELEWLKSLPCFIVLLLLKHAISWLDRYKENIFNMPGFLLSKQAGLFCLSILIKHIDGECISQSLTYCVAWSTPQSFSLDTLSTVSMNEWFFWMGGGITNYDSWHFTRKCTWTGWLVKLLLSFCFIGNFFSFICFFPFSTFVISMEIVQSSSHFKQWGLIHSISTRNKLKILLPLSKCHHFFLLFRLNLSDLAIFWQNFENKVYLLSSRGVMPAFSSDSW